MLDEIITNMSTSSNRRVEIWDIGDVRKVRGGHWYTEDLRSDKKSSNVHRKFIVGHVHHVSKIVVSSWQVVGIHERGE